MNKGYNRQFSPENPWYIGLAIVGLIGGVFLITSVMQDTTNRAALCKTTTSSVTKSSGTAEAAELQLDAILHYATSRIVPQQSFNEISVTLRVLKSMGKPVNFLVFGLGHDSLMWAGLNPNGNTLFLEEDPSWVQTVLKDAPNLKAQTVKYRTQLAEADELINMYRTEPSCFAKNAVLRGNERCKLALNMLSDEVYDKEWDLIMIDAPRGYFPEAPGRMAAIFSAAVMARNRKGSGVTHVFLHDVDRKVEKAYGELFLCRKYLVEGVGRLWHFEIPPSDDDTNVFC